jgi:hypothetical protein
MAEFASRGSAATGIALGASGLGVALANGGLGNVLGGILGNNCNTSCNPMVNRYELNQSEIISKLQSEISLRDANIFADQKLLEVYKYFDGQIKDIRATMCENDKALAVSNAKIEGTFAVLGERMNAQHNEFMCAINRERDQRCCGLAELTQYVNATFYPKMVADITTGTTTTAQVTYNPISNCGCCR